MAVARTASLTFVLLLLAACVTINIYFPAAEAREAAEKIVDDILGSEPAAQPAAPAGDRGSSLERAPWVGLAGRLLDGLVAPAHAATPDFSVDSPEIRRLQAQMKERHPDLAPFYQQGVIGFDRQARVAIRDAGAIALRDRKRIEQLVAAENADRDRLYRAIAAANGRPEWEPDVREVFARTWIEKAAAGWWYQDAQGRWQQSR